MRWHPHPLPFLASSSQVLFCLRPHHLSSPSSWVNHCAPCSSTASFYRAFENQRTGTALHRQRCQASKDGYPRFEEVSHTMVDLTGLTTHSLQGAHLQMRLTLVSIFIFSLMKRLFLKVISAFKNPLKMTHSTMCVSQGPGLTSVKTGTAQEILISNMWLNPRMWVLSQCGYWPFKGRPRARSVCFHIHFRDSRLPWQLNAPRLKDPPARSIAWADPGSWDQWPCVCQTDILGRK